MPKTCWLESSEFRFKNEKVADVNCC